MNEVEHIVKAFKQYNSLKATSKEVNVSYHRVRKILTSQGIVINETHEIILNLYYSGKTISEIANVVHLTPKTVSSYLPPKRPIYRINRSPNAERIANWRENKKKGKPKE